MRLDTATLVAIALMALVTYLTRIAGLVLAGRFAPQGRAKAAFDAIPPAVLTAVIAPTLITTGWAESLAGAITILAAFRLPLLATVVVGVASVIVLRFVLG